MTYELPKLEYSYDSLEPFIDAKTMEIHHSKHHKTYVDNLNKALEGHLEFQKKPVEDLIKNLNKIPEAIRNAVKNNGGGHYNHSLFWKLLKKNVKMPKEIQKAIEERFGSIEKFKEEFKQAALTQFGSGWAWLVVDKNGNLVITKTANQDCPLSNGDFPILALDVWEHAYYLKYQNKRADYVDAFWNVVNWKLVEDLYLNATG